MDYKEQLPGNGDEQRKDYLFDVASFANVAGGDLIFGISDQKDSAGRATGIPQAADGLTIQNESAEILRLEGMLRTGIAPRIAGIKLKVIPGFQKGSVLVLRIPRSWAAPHMVTFKGTNKFYSRSTVGKYPMGVEEIRAAFVSSADLADTIRRFRLDRLEFIRNGDTPLGLKAGGHVVLHLLPLSAILRTDTADVAAGASRLTNLLRPIGATSWSHRFNYEGFLTYAPTIESYVQLFRSGALEAAESRFLKLSDEIKSQFGITQNFISTLAFERELINGAIQYLKALQALAVNSPFVAMVSLLGTKGVRIATGPQTLSTDEIDRDPLLLPDVVLESYEMDIGRAFKPAFDTLWQAAGLPGSDHYDEQGNWQGVNNQG